MSTPEGNTAVIEIGPLKISFPMDMPESARLVQGISIPALSEREHYAGLILDDNEKPIYHLILLPGEADAVTWETANEGAAQQCGSLPTRREQSLLFANLKAQFQECAYWSCERDRENVGWAWCQTFGDGDQGSTHAGLRLRARAVRRLPI